VENLSAVVARYMKTYMAQHLQEWDPLLSLAEFTGYVVCHKTLKTSLCWAVEGFVHSIPIDLLVPISNANWMPNTGLEADESATQMMSNL
jgi:hypothetical protein